MSLIVNLYAGPGTGKSTTMAGIFHLLKLQGVNCEMAPEFAKEKVWERSTHLLGNQLYITAKQHMAQWRLHDQVDVIITDAPLLFGLIYGKAELSEYHDLVRALHYMHPSMNFFLDREKPYNPAGRTQTEEAANTLDSAVLQMLENESILFERLPANVNTAPYIAREVLKFLDGQ